eukprot:TRINITY_DN59628_c0_g1_i1.p6 TRINITY_DN59628_c0_g1~~TRINITY_DN59628_c0_g1_i1.p6  ORF type:complete len:101 (+),score=8.79 TRINITY_DN59628_c0_g1_i1:298-600(+)
MHLNKYNCCIGLFSKLKHFENEFKCNITEAIKNKLCEGIISLENINNAWSPSSNIGRCINSKCRLKGKKVTMRDYIKNAWNSNSNLSPQNFFWSKVFRDK